MLESRVEASLKRAAESRGGLSVKLLGQIGLPDRLILLPGPKILFVETKAPGKRPRKIQRWWHDKLRKLGFRVEVIDTPEQARAVCDV